MDNASKKILTLQTVDKRMTGRKSAAMEKVGFQAAMDDLNAKGVGVVEVVTDAHMGIGALISELKNNINIIIFFINYKKLFNSLMLPDILV